VAFREEHQRGAYKMATGIVPFPAAFVNTLPQGVRKTGQQFSRAGRECGGQPINEIGLVRLERLHTRAQRASATGTDTDDPPAPGVAS
jgi:hypothetical protein